MRAFGPGLISGKVDKPADFVVEYIDEATGKLGKNVSFCYFLKNVLCRKSWLTIIFIVIDCYVTNLLSL